MPSKYDPETRAKAVRLVLDHRDDYPSEWAAITAVSKRLGMNAETLRNWIRQQQADDGKRDGLSSEAAAEIRALKLAAVSDVTHVAGIASGSGVKHLDEPVVAAIEQSWLHDDRMAAGVGPP
jgi:transposase-like protein